MNINLIYQKNAFNFDLRKDICVKYLQDLSSKLISKDKSKFSLLYKNKDLSKNPEFLLKDLINKEETNIPIEIALKNYSKFNVKKILPKININRNIRVDSREKYHKPNTLLNKTEIYNLSNKENLIKDLKDKNYSTDKYRDSRNNKNAKNEIFEAVYNNKESEILTLMNKLSQIIKEYDAILYKKRNIDRINKEILLFEKNILEFKNNLFNLLQKLINYFDKKESNYFRGNIDLKDFYLDLKFNILKNDKKKKTKEIIYPQTSQNSENISHYKEDSSSIPKLDKNYEFKPKNKILNTKLKPEKNIKINKSLNERNEIENSIFKGEKKIFQEKIFNKSFGLSKIQENMNNKNYLNKKIIDKDESDNTESENSNLSKPQNKFHIIKHANIINEINNDSSRINTNSINKNNNSDLKDNEDIEHIKLLKGQNNPTKYSKIATLFEITESKNNTSKDNDSNQNDTSSLENSKKEDDNIIVKKLNSRKSFNGFVKNNRFGFMIRDKSRKATKRAKKWGMNENDFLI